MVWLERARPRTRYEPRHFPYFNLARVYVKQNRLREAIAGAAPGRGHRAALRHRATGDRAPAASPGHAELTAIPLPFYGNPLLFGRDETSGLLAFVPDESTVRVYARREGQVVITEEPFRPFLLLDDADLLGGFKGDVDVTPLEGDGAFRWLAAFPAWSAAERGRDHLRKLTGRTSGDPQGPYLFLADPVHQHLLRTGRTSFRGMALTDVLRMAVDIEVLTAPGFEFPNAAREADRIIAIAMADSTGWSQVLSGAAMNEAALLRECTRLDRGARPRRARGPQYLPLRPRVPRGAAPGVTACRSPGGATAPPAGPPVPHAGGGAQHRLPALRCRRARTSWTPGCWASSTTWPRATWTPTG